MSRNFLSRQPIPSPKQYLNIITDIVANDGVPVSDERFLIGMLIHHRVIVKEYKLLDLLGWSFEPGCVDFITLTEKSLG